MLTGIDFSRTSDSRTRVKIYFVRRPCGYVSICGWLPQVVRTAVGLDIAPAIRDGKVDPFFRPEALCEFVGDLIHVPRRPLGVMVVWIDIEALQQFDLRPETGPGQIVD